MRVCELHRERAVDTLTSTQTGREFDLCEECLKKLHAILRGAEVLFVAPSGMMGVDSSTQTQEAPRRGRKRATAAPDGA